MDGNRYECHCLFNYCVVKTFYFYPDEEWDDLITGEIMSHTCKLEVTIRKAPSWASDPQMKKYFSRIVPRCQEGFRQIGEDYTIKETRQQLEGRFLFREYIDDNNDTQRLYLSLRKDSGIMPTKEEMAEFMDRCIYFANTDLMIEV